jgi:hypothetical protein
MNRWNESASPSERAESTDGPTDRWQRWTSAAGEAVGLDEQLDLLSDADRRHVLECLSPASEPTELPALVDCVVARHGASADAERVLLRLHHVHLPRLADAGVLSYEAANGLVRGRADRIAALLELRDAAVA